MILSDFSFISSRCFFRTNFLIFIFIVFSLLFVQTIFGIEPPETNPALTAVFDSIKAPDNADNTQIRLITTNDEAWYCRWKMVEEAKKTIDITYFIVHSDVYGKSFLGLLRKKAHEGVKIRMMLDGRGQSWGGKGHYNLVEELAALPNVEIKFYNTVKKQLLSIFSDFRKILSSNHDKIIIVDGFTSIIGGRNIGVDYFGAAKEHPIIYRDTDVVMRGKYAAGQLKIAFDEEWNLLKNMSVKPNHDKESNQYLDLVYRSMQKYMTGRGVLNGDKSLSEDLKKTLEEINKELTHYKNISSYASYEMFHGERVKPVRILDKHSCVGVRNDISANIIRFVDAAKSEICIQNPYVVLSNEAKAALKRASDRGVKIVLHTNSGASTDNSFTQAFFLDDWKKLLIDMLNLQIFVAKSRDDKLHSKVFCFDSQITIVGSYNLDPMSEIINSEIVAVIKDKPFSVQTRLRIQKDIGNTLQYKIEIQENGKIKVISGPEDHVSKNSLYRMYLIRKFQWIRPLI